MLLSERFEPCLDPLRLSGREFGLEFAREPPGVMPVLILKNNKKIFIRSVYFCVMARMMNFCYDYNVSLGTFTSSNTKKC